MKRNIKFLFKGVAQGDPEPSPGLTIVIRTDARHATASLKQNIVGSIQQDVPDPLSPDEVTALDARVEKNVHMAYQEWGHNVLSALADCLDYERYGLTAPDDKNINVHFYNAHDLSKAVLEKADELVRQTGFDKSGIPAVYVSLDDMIEGQGENWSEIAFSRLFSAQGDQQGHYMARPGSKPIEEQMRDLNELLVKIRREHGARVPIVFLEDNVRHAKMLNWVIGKMQENGIFENAELIGIASCFCCANAEERSAIKSEGKTIPIAAVADYGDAKVDVATPRDLLFDGFVVQLMDRTARLPAVFMDIEKLFKIRSDKKDEFREMVMDANIGFCERLEQELGMRIPMSWFSVADAVSQVTGLDPELPMAEVLKRKPANQNPPPPDAGLKPA